jgi:hypothetical protein
MVSFGQLRAVVRKDTVYHLITPKGKHLLDSSFSYLSNAGSSYFAARSTRTYWIFKEEKKFKAVLFPAKFTPITSCESEGVCIGLKFPQAMLGSTSTSTQPVKRLDPSRRTEVLGVLTKQGEFIAFRDEVCRLAEFTEAKAAFAINKDTAFPYKYSTALLWGYLRLDGTVLIPAQFDHALPFYQGKAWVKSSTDYFLIDSTGKKCSQEYSFDYVEPLPGGQYFRVQKKNKFGLVDHQGNWLKPMSKRYVVSFSDELLVSTSAPLVENKKESFLSSVLLLESKYSIRNTRSYKYFLERTTDGKTVQKKLQYIIGEFSQGYCVASENGKYGLLQSNGEWKIKPQYEQMLPFQEGLMAVWVDGKWGYINIQNEWVIKPVFDEAFSFFK